MIEFFLQAFARCASCWWLFVVCCCLARCEGLAEKPVPSPAGGVGGSSFLSAADGMVSGRPGDSTAPIVVYRSVSGALCVREREGWGVADGGKIKASMVLSPVIVPGSWTTVRARTSY